ncbi:MAG TPA: sulfite exporter TauE/SafE family protein [Methanocella sp.]|nr:sulfite exporter TauE/SafE family protein [Methanocella sp.]
MMVEIWAGIATLIATAILTIAGVGAAFILIPVYLFLGVDLLTAMSTALLLNAIAMVFASATYAREKLILWRIALPIIIIAAILSPIGAYTSVLVPKTTLLILFIGFLLFAATMMLFYKPKNTMTDKDIQNLKPAKVLGVGGAFGGVAGFVGGLLGVGGGNIILPGLVWLGIPPKKASATTAFIVIFSSFAGFLGRASVSNLNLNLLILTAAGSIGGALIGSWLMSKKLENKQVKTVIGIILYLIALKMIIDMI